MNGRVVRVTVDMANEILTWKYEKPYDIYNNEWTEAWVRELVGGSYYALVEDGHQLIGYFCTGASAQVPDGHQSGVYEEGLVDIGLGMKPSLTGQGRGYSFCSCILRFLEEKYENIPIRLTVAKFNQRAIHVYEKLGFRMEDEFSSDGVGFMTMVRWGCM